MTTFKITIHIGQRILTFTVQKLSASRNAERYMVRGKNGDIIVESNRPTLERVNLKYWEVKWKQVGGQKLSYSSALDKICQAIDEVIGKTGF